MIRPETGRKLKDARTKIYDVIEVSEDSTTAGKIYDGVMISAIILSLVPLVFKEMSAALVVIDRVTAFMFIIDYLLRLATADIKMKEKNMSFLLYPFTPMALVDLISILPSFSLLGGEFKLLRIFRLFRGLRIFRVFKMFRYSKNIVIIANVIKKQKTALLAVCSLAAAYILLAALIIFNVEPDTFDTFFDAIYWATISLTTLGYGDIYPVTTAGQIVTMLSAVLGVAVIAMPAGVITAGYMNELEEYNDGTRDGAETPGGRDEK